MLSPWSTGRSSGEGPNDDMGADLVLLVEDKSCSLGASCSNIRKVCSGSQIGCVSMDWYWRPLAVPMRADSSVVILLSTLARPLDGTFTWHDLEWRSKVSLLSAG